MSSLPRPLDTSSCQMTAAMAPSGQPVSSAIADMEPYNKISGQPSGAASASSLAEARRGEEAFYRQSELPTLVASQTGSRSSSSLGYHSQTGSGGVFSSAHDFSIGHMNAVEAQSVGTQIY
ncbi:hypothetical protein P691DRAFT_768424 [Macrolepiota fuliginosa MF-IS2]|uniref:Uncharacterized protein n=1 Tax=Macrolepiota fuliginosa MF-IS2 TaxID=1400762 RepID=A0A9P5WWF2_9AGAR|nr:hypothetical protein P691DRAFT_768424 [Macrolepiota fuliginosa MF-IS2]